jgi:type 1 glutamine amidotransferase
MQRLIPAVAVFVASVAALCCSLPAAENPAAAKTKRVVIVTGEDYSGHKWRETTPVVKAALVEDRRLDVTVVEDLKFLATPELRKFDVAVLHFKNYDPKVPGPEGQKNLDEFARAGGGVVLIHFACGAFQEWPEFVKLAGRVWNPKLRGHDPHGTFRVEMTGEKHPITTGLKAFDTTDELYTCLDGETPVKVLATAVSKVDQKVYPIAFVLDYGKGRTFHTVLGHDVKALSAPAAAQLLRRGAAWAAGLDIPRPSMTETNRSRRALGECEPGLFTSSLSAAIL